MKFTFLHWLVVGLVAIIIYLILSRPSKPESSTIVNARDSISQLLEANVVNSMQARTLETRLAQATVKSRSDSARFIREITVKNQQLARKRVVVQHVIDTIPELKEFVETADAVIQLQRERIDTLEQNLKFREGLYNDLVYMKAKQISNLEMIVGQQGVIIKDLEKQARKKRRGAKLWKAAAVTLGVAGVLVGSQL